MGVENQIARIEGAVDEQAALIAQIQTGLEGKAAGGGSGGVGDSDEHLLTVLLPPNAAGCFFVVDGVELNEFNAGGFWNFLVGMAPVGSTVTIKYGVERGFSDSNLFSARRGNGETVEHTLTVVKNGKDALAEFTFTMPNDPVTFYYVDYENEDLDVYIETFTV